MRLRYTPQAVDEFDELLAAIAEQSQLAFWLVSAKPGTACWSILEAAS